MGKNSVELRVSIRATAIIKLHSLESGEEEELDFEDYRGVEEKDGKTYVSYYTDWEDCPTDGFYAKESVEEVKEMVDEAIKRLSESYDRYVIVPKHNIESVEYGRNTTNIVITK